MTRAALAAFALLLACAGCRSPSPFERQVREMEPTIRDGVAALRGVRPEAPITLVPHRWSLPDPPGIASLNGRPTSIGSCALDRARYAGERGLLVVAEGERILEPAHLAGVLAHAFSHELQARRGAAGLGEGDRAWVRWVLLEGEAILMQLAVDPRPEQPVFRHDWKTPSRDAGLAYVLEQFGRGGWPAVEAVVDSPPRTSAELLFGTHRWNEPPPLEGHSLAGASVLPVGAIAAIGPLGDTEWGHGIVRPALGATSVLYPSEASPFVAALVLRYPTPKAAEEVAARALMARVERVGACLVFDVHRSIPDAEWSALLRAVGER